jgi:hypothetical protein
MPARALSSVARSSSTPPHDHSIHSLQLTLCNASAKVVELFEDGVEAQRTAAQLVARHCASSGTFLCHIALN